MRELNKKYIVSFSGGKDSTAMLLRLLEEDYLVDDIVMFDTGWEFPEMHIHALKVQDYIKREITILKPEKSFLYWMIERKIVARKAIEKGSRIGYGWPSPMRRWCTRQKIDGIERYIKNKHGKNTASYIGFAADEVKRTGCGNACAGETRNGTERLYPLIFDWDMDEKACLKYCYDRGFNWGGLYEHFRRVSCFCCPLKRIGELRTLRKHFPHLWGKMLAWDSMMPGHNRGFYGYKTVHDLDRRFAEEERQLIGWSVEA
jgi:3'-phosphoadenosine 5'-phosphosulfate sulfotransferase (PAPS reductase)/FAD synthetase